VVFINKQKVSGFLYILQAGNNNLLRYVLRHLCHKGVFAPLFLTVLNKTAFINVVSNLRLFTTFHKFVFIIAAVINKSMQEYAGIIHHLNSNVNVP